MLQRIRRSIVLFAESQQRVLRAQSGQSLVILAFAFLGLIAMLGLALDLGLVYIERVRIKRAVDAATLAGVVELPLEEDAFSRAIEYLNLNGYDIDPLNGNANVYVVGCVRDPASGSYIDYTTPYTYIQVPNPRVSFIMAAMPAPNTPRNSNDCNASLSNFGNANRLAITGTVAVNMNFMQFFGFREVPVQDSAVAQNVTNLDVVVVFDTSGSMEYGTVCYDCWVRTDTTNPDYPNNGYYNPIPKAVLNSNLCSSSQVPYVDPSSGKEYLIAEAELAAVNPALWETRYRQTGEGYWAIQRGSRNGDYGNQAGDPSKQSSNVCLVPGIDCTVPGDSSDNLCKDDPLSSNDVFVDCSAYISHHPIATYGQQRPPAELLGMFYYLDNVINRDPEPPKLEYDFTPNWSGPTHIWIRAQGGGTRAYEPIYQDPFVLNKSTIYWDVQSPDDGFNPQANTAAPGVDYWRDNRADPDKWQWIHLGTTTATVGEAFVLRLWAGSPGYDIDKIVVTNDTHTNPSQIGALTYDNNIGRPATAGSATRAACDPCNAIYGLSVIPEQCSVYSPVLTPTNNLDNPLFGDIEPLRSSQEAVKRFIQRLDPEFDQAGFVPFTEYIYRAGQSQLECRKRDGTACYEGTSPISYTRVLAKVEHNSAINGTDIAWGMLEGLKELGVNVANEPQCTPSKNPIDDNCFDNSCTSNLKTGCGRGGAATRVMVVLTDGSPNSDPVDEKHVSCGNDPVYNFPDEIPDSDSYDCVIYYAGKALENNVIIYTIGLGDGARADLLQMAAETARGQYFLAPTPEGLDIVFEAIISTTTTSCSPQNLTLTKSATPTEGLGVGDIITYSLSFSNSGDLAATNVVLTDRLPINTQLVTASGSFTPPAPTPGDVITWTLGQLEGGARGVQSLTVVISPTQPGDVITNVAGIYGEQDWGQAMITIPFTPPTIDESHPSYLPIILKSGER
jgi:uncharacterized repeat protein (TIGR01451 family)